MLFYSQGDVCDTEEGDTAAAELAKNYLFWRNVALICSHDNCDTFDLYKHLFEGERLPESSPSDD